jgi:hypothetical protein
VAPARDTCDVWTMARRTSVLLLWPLVLAGAALGAPAKKKAPAPPAPPPLLTAPTPKVQEALSDKALTVLDAAERAQAYEARDSGGLRPDPARAIASDFVRGEAGAELDPKQLARLKSLLYDERSYRLEQDVSRCRFVPQVSFQLQAGLDTLETLVSFSCNQVLFITGKPGGRWIPLGTFDVKPARKALLALAQATLPKSEALKRLR